MMHRPFTLRTALVLAVLLAGCAAQPEAQQSQRDSTAADSARPAAPDSAVVVATALPDSILTPKAPLVPTPDPLRGLYVNRWAALSTRKMGKLIDVAKKTEINALVIDVKDDRGYMLYDSRIPLAGRIGADDPSIGLLSRARLRAMLDSMRVHGIYPIARIVVVKDPLLAEKRLEWAIARKADPTQAWRDRSGNPWLDPNQPGVWQYAVDIAKEAVDLGFSEIQFDYVRFPDEDRIIREATFPLQKGRTRAQVIRDQLAEVRKQLAPLGVPITIDVFGLTTSDTTDMGIGQRWEMFVDQADVVLPMVYPSHYAPGSYGIARPNANPYAVIDRALEDAKRRSEGIAGAAEVIPWYQDFTLGAPRYGVPQVRAQIDAGYDNGVMSWILWNPGSNYTIEALRPPGADSVAAAAPAPVDSAEAEP